MDLVKKILDLPVIVQGALGSFLFWLIYELSKRAIAGLGRFIGKHNRNWRQEALSFERMQAIAMSTDDSGVRASAMLGCLYGGLSRAVQGLIDIGLGML